MFNNDSWLRYQEQIGVRTKQLEEIIIQRIAGALAKDSLLDKAKWAEKQRARMLTVDKQIISDISRASKDIQSVANEGLQYALKQSSYNGISLQAGKESVAMKMNAGLATLLRTAINDYHAMISSVSLDSRDLFTTIQQAIRDKSDRGFVVYGNGRKVSFKSYMEMSVRTELSNNAQYNLEQSSKAAGVQFFVASSHSDSAPDHADFQGYFYLADGVVWQDEWSKYNFHPKYKYLSEVKELGFLTRPNCRHFVQPVTLEQLSQPNKVKELLHMPNEKASSRQYDYLTEQRSNERNIRKYKERVATQKEMLRNLPVDASEQRSALEASIKSDRALARQWSARQKDFTQKHGLVREPIRERAFTIAHDLGAKKGA